MMEQYQLEIPTTTFKDDTTADHFSDVEKMIDSEDSVSRIRDALRRELKKRGVNMISDFGGVVCVVLRFKELGYVA
jgi:amino acid permease